MTFRPGDRVTITNPSPENAKWRGKTGTGFRGFYADELKAA